MTHEQLLNKLYCEDLNFIGVNYNPLYNLAKKNDKTITKEFVSNWLKVNPHNSKRLKRLKRKNTN
jgi:hypothetical protein